MVNLQADTDAVQPSSSGTLPWNLTAPMLSSRQVAVRHQLTIVVDIMAEGSYQGCQPVHGGQAGYRQLPVSLQAKQVS